MVQSPYAGSLDALLEELPAPNRIAQAPPPEDVSCVIAIAGFEPRCTSAAQSMLANGWRAQRSVCVRYRNSEMEPSNSQYVEPLCSLLSLMSHGTTPEMLEHDDHSVGLGFGDQLIQTLKEMNFDLSATTHLVFDITVGSSRLLLEGLHAILQTNVRLTLVYTEVSDYRPAFEEYQKHVEERRVRHLDAPEFLTRGVDRVEVLKSIPGQNADSRPAYLVVFPAFAFTRISAVIDELAPSRVQWIFGIPHLVKNRWRIDAQREYHQSLVERSHRHCFVSTFDYRETLQVLDRIYQQRRASYGMFVASLGSKLQKVGQALFHVLRPEAAAVVSIPRVWNEDRFSGEEPRAVYALRLGNCGELREGLWRTRRLRT
jgi:hypothetical protein